MQRCAAYIKIFFFSFLLWSYIIALAQNGESVYNDNDLEERDPFIALIDEKGQMRTDFRKPSQGSLAPKVSLMGINKVGNVYYALIDGELLKEGDVFKELKIQKIDADSVTVKYGDKVFELKWGTGKK